MACMLNVLHDSVHDVCVDTLSPQEQTKLHERKFMKKTMQRGTAGNSFFFIDFLVAKI